MNETQAKAPTLMDSLFRTGYPHPFNLFVTLMVTLVPLLAPLAGGSEGALRPPLNYFLAGGLALGYLLGWSRLRVHNPMRSTRFYQGYLIAQTIVVSLIYVLDGGLTRFLFVVVAVQAVYVTPVRRWAPFLVTVSVLWLTLYLVLSPEDPGASRVVKIGMYLCYLIFAAVVTFTTVQQDRQVQIARELLSGVGERHQALRAYDLSAEQVAEVEERDRLGQTIYAVLSQRLSSLLEHLNRLVGGSVPLYRQHARAARLEAKEVLGSVREAVRTLRPGDHAEMEEEEEGALGLPTEPGLTVADTDPIRIYHVWNSGVIVVTTGVIMASDLVAQTSRWLPLLGLGVALAASYLGAALARQTWIRTAYLILQAGLCVRMTWLSEEPLMNHLLLIVAAQIVFLFPLLNRGLAAAVAFPTLLSATALWTIEPFERDPVLLLTWTAALCVTFFFGAVMAFMTRRQVEARQEAVTYAEQLAQVNRLLEARLQEVRRVTIARERIRMAREIHDTLGHHMTTAIVELQTAEELADEDRQAAVDHINSAQRIIQAAMRSSREMVQSLERFDHPLPAALRELISVWQRGNGARVSLRVSGDFSTVSTAIRITLYRVVQESLTNIQKHANARHVEINLVRQKDRVLLNVANDSEGAVPRGEPGPGGFGLVGLRERADALQGEFLAGLRADGGFHVHVVLPLGA